MDEMDNVFHSLAHPTRRQILDLVKEQPGIHTGDLCSVFEASRIAIIKHIKVLENAGLLIIEKEGRFRCHYFNSLPIQVIYERWTDKYSQFFSSRLNSFKEQLEQQSKQEHSDEKIA